MPELSESNYSNGPVQENTVLASKIVTLNQQNNQLDSVWKDLYSVADRLRNIGNKLNSVAHPDNQEKANVSGIASAKPQPMPTDGLVGALNENIETTGKANRRVQRQYLRQVGS